jgi:hypothetical protein
MNVPLFDAGTGKEVGQGGSAGEDAPCAEGDGAINKSYRQITISNLTNNSLFVS